MTPNTTAVTHCLLRAIFLITLLNLSVLSFVKYLNLLNYLKKSEFYTVTNKILSTSEVMQDAKGEKKLHLTWHLCVFTQTQMAFIVMYLYNNCINVNSLHKVLIIVDYECCSIKCIQS